MQSKEYRHAYYLAHKKEAQHYAKVHAKKIAAYKVVSLDGGGITS